MAFYDRFARTLASLIKKAGTSDYKLVRKSSGTVLIDPLRPSMGYANTSTTYNLKSILPAINARQVKNEVFRSTDTQLYISPVDLLIIPLESDTISHTPTGKTFEIIGINTYEVSGSNIVFVCQLRGS